MGGSPTSAGRDTGRKGHQRCLTKDSDLPTLGDPYGPPQADPPTPQQAPSIQGMQHDGIWGGPMSLGTPSPGVPTAHGGHGALTWLAGGSLWDRGEPPRGPAGTAGKTEEGLLWLRVGAHGSWRGSSLFFGGLGTASAQG